MIKSIVKKTTKKIAIKQGGLKESKKIVVVASHITPEIKKLIALGYRMSRPETEPHKVYKLCKAGFFKAGKKYVVKSFQGFTNTNLCLNAQNLIEELTKLKLVDKVFDKTRTGTISKKHITSFSLVK